jgi:hypothetical protein
MSGGKLKRAVTVITEHRSAHDVWKMSIVHCVHVQVESMLEALLYVRTWNFYRDSTWNFGTTHGAVPHCMLVVALVVLSEAILPN